MLCCVRPSSRVPSADYVYPVNINDCYLRFLLLLLFDNVIILTTCFWARGLRVHFHSFMTYREGFFFVALDSFNWTLHVMLAH